MRWFALSGPAGPVLFAAVVVICAAMRPGYSHVDQFISELGASGTPNALVMNAAGFLPTGTLIVVFGLSLVALLPGRPVFRVSGVLVGLFGLGLLTAGLVPCAPGCPQDPPSLHDGISVAGFISALVGIGACAYGFRSTPRWQRLWFYSAVSSGIGLCILVALASSLDSRSLTGLWQRLLAGTLFLWCAVVGIKVFRNGSPPRSARAGAAREGRCGDPKRT